MTPFAAVVFFICHVVFFQYLDNKPVSRTLGQGLQSAVANFFPLFVDVCIVGCLSVAYDQILWNLLRKSAFPTVVIDQLVHLHGSPWELVHPRILRQLLRIKRIVILTLLCAGIPFALVFPPGAVTTDNKIQLRESLNDVPITNITDFGNGSVSQLFDHSLFNMAAALNYEL